MVRIHSGLHPLKHRRAGFNEGVCEAQGCILVFEDGNVEGPVGTLPDYIYEGALKFGTEDRPNMIRLPCQVIGIPVVLTLSLADDYRKIVVAGSKLSVQLEGEVRLVEQFQPLCQKRK